MRTKKKPDMHGRISMLGDNRDDNTGVPAVARVTDNARAAESKHWLQGRRPLWARCNCNRKLFPQFIIIDCQQHRHVQCLGIFFKWMEYDLWVISLQVKASTKAPPKGSEDSAALKQEIKDLNARIQQLETEARRGSVVKGAGAETAADVSLWSKDQISTVFRLLSQVAQEEGGHFGTMSWVSGEYVAYLPSPQKLLDKLLKIYFWTWWVIKCNLTYCIKFCILDFLHNISAVVLQSFLNWQTCALMEEGLTCSALLKYCIILLAKSQSYL